MNFNKANETLVKMLDAMPSNYKVDINKDKIKENQYKLVYILKDLISSINISSKLEKPFNKINNVLETYLSNKELPIVDIEKNELEDMDKIYYIVAIIEKLKKVTGFKIEINDKLKNINLSYLVPIKKL